MTREEAIRCLDVYSSTNGSGLCTDKQHYEAKRMAIKALEQEPCEDAIRRQAVIDKIFESRNNFYNEFDQGFFADKIRALPPVTPQQKTGHWIANRAKNYPGWIHCSECGEDWTHDGRPPYCPACGAKMIEEK